VPVVWKTHWIVRQISYMYVFITCIYATSKMTHNFLNTVILDDNKLLYETDEVINARLESLMNLFLKTTSDDTGQMILNVFETYRKYLIRDVKFQCKLSCATVEKLINYYMITLCHRKCGDNISSTVRYFISN